MEHAAKRDQRGPPHGGGKGGASESKSRLSAAERGPAVTYRILDANLCCIVKSETDLDTRLHSSERIPLFIDQVVRKVAPDLGMLQELRPCFYHWVPSPKDSNPEALAFSFDAPGNATLVVEGLYRCGYEVVLPCVDSEFPFLNAVFFRRDDWKAIDPHPRPVYYSFCKEGPRRWYAFVVTLEHKRTGVRLAVINTHFPLELDHRMSCAAEFNALAREVSQRDDLDAVIAGGDTNIFADKQGDRQEAALIDGATWYLTETLEVDLDLERSIFGERYREIDDAGHPVGTFVGYEYDAVRPTSDRCQSHGEGTDRCGKLDALMLFANRRSSRWCDAKVAPVTFPWRHELEEGHLSSMTWRARKYPKRKGTVDPPISDHVPILVDLTFDLSGRRGLSC